MLAGPQSQRCGRSRQCATATIASKTDNNQTYVTLTHRIVCSATHEPGWNVTLTGVVDVVHIYNSAEEAETETYTETETETETETAVRLAIDWLVTR